MRICVLILQRAMLQSPRLIWLGSSPQPDGPEYQSESPVLCSPAPDFWPFGHLTFPSTVCRIRLLHFLEHSGIDCCVVDLGWRLQVDPSGEVVHRSQSHPHHHNPFSVAVGNLHSLGSGTSGKYCK